METTMTKRENTEFVQRLLYVLESGVEIKSWAQVRVASAALAKALG